MFTQVNPFIVDGAYSEEIVDKIVAKAFQSMGLQLIAAYFELNSLGKFSNKSILPQILY